MRRYIISVALKTETYPAKLISRSMSVETISNGLSLTFLNLRNEPFCEHWHMTMFYNRFVCTVENDVPAHASINLPAKKWFSKSAQTVANGSKSDILNIFSSHALFMPQHITNEIDIP